MLHHYTSVNTLALILRYRTIRFTRLDQFDDVTEGRSIGSYPAGARLFSSCWSAAEDESIPQWAMYGDSMKGVRLSLRPDPFQWQVIDFDWHENFKVVALEAPFSLEEMFGMGINLIPTPDMRRMFGRPVSYVPDVTAAIGKFVTPGSAGEIVLRGEGTEIAFFKSADWEFQKEYRFVFGALPGPPEPYRGDHVAYLEARRSWQQSGINFLAALPDRVHVDLKLDVDALMNGEVTVGPLAPSGTLEIVESLVSRFAPGATVRTSQLSGTIRPR